MSALGRTIHEAVAPILARYQLFMGEPARPERVAIVAEAYALALSVDDAPARHWAALGLVQVLHGSREEVPAGWWRTELGQLCLPAFPNRPATTAEAAAVLGVTVQRIRELLEDPDKLVLHRSGEPGPEGSPRKLLVTRESLVARWRYMSGAGADRRPLADDCNLPD